MKNFTLLFIILMLIQITATAQPRLPEPMPAYGGQACLPEGITFTTQTQIDSFQIIYPNCTEVEGDVKIYGDNISNLNGLNVLTSIAGGLTIGDGFFLGNELLIDLTGLENLSLIGGRLRIYHNVNLTSLTGLDNLHTIEGDLFIGGYSTSWGDGGNPSLKSLTGLESLKTVRGRLETAANDSLTSFQGLENLDSIGGIITYDPISSLSQLNNLAYIGNVGLGIYYTDLTSLTGFENVTSIAGSVILDGNDSLVSLNGLENLASIDGDLAIGGALHDKPGNSSLVSLTGLDNLVFIGGNLRIDKNDVLTSLTGLENLTSLGGGNLSIGSDTTLWGGGNQSLVSLEGLDNINANSLNEVAILFNNSLTICNVASICDYLSPNATAEIHDNAPGCNSQAEVDTACKYSFVGEISILDKLLIHPNPFNQTVTIEYELTKPSTVQLTIYDYLGKQVEVIEQNQAQGKQQVIWDAEGLPAGVYFCVVKTESGTQTMKMIKL